MFAYGNEEETILVSSVTPTVDVIKPKFINGTDSVQNFISQGKGGRIWVSGQETSLTKRELFCLIIYLKYHLKYTFADSSYLNASILPVTMDYDEAICAMAGETNSIAYWVTSEECKVGSELTLDALEALYSSNIKLPSNPQITTTGIARYKLFAGYRYYPGGGCIDYIESSDNLELLTTRGNDLINNNYLVVQKGYSVVNELIRCNWFNILDIISNEVIVNSDTSDDEENIYPVGYLPINTNKLTVDEKDINESNIIPLIT